MCKVRKTKMREISNKGKLGMVAVLAVICIIIGLTIFYQNPIRKTKLYLELKEYRQAVNLYNCTNYSESAQNEIDIIIKTILTDTKDLWINGKLSFDQATSILEAFETIDNVVIKNSAIKNLSYINVEHAGDEILAEAEIYFDGNDFLDAMKCLKNIDASYSNYHVLQDIYDDSREMLLNNIGIPETVKEYETAISTLENYILEVDDANFTERKESLEEELTEYKKIYNILSEATELFENASYKESFKKMEEGLKNYPDNNKLQYAYSSYQYAYILNTTGQVIGLTEEEKYDEAIELLNTAIDTYDCASFQELLKTVKMKDSILYAAKVRFSDAGNYVFKSAKKLVLGDFSEDEQDTLLSLGGSVASSLVGADAPLDVRDLAYDVTHWGEGDYFAARLALDAVGVIPVIGALKYLKHVDNVADVAKNVKKGTDIADTAKDVKKSADTADGLHDIANAADKAHDIVNATDSMTDAGKAIDDVVSDVIKDVKKKSKVVSDLTDDFSDYVKKAEDAVDVAESIAKKGGSYGEVFKPGEGEFFEVHHTPADSASSILSRNEGPAIKMDKADHVKTSSWGNSLEAKEYVACQRKLIDEGNFREAVQMDIDDIHDKFGNKYDDAIEEMLQYVDDLIEKGIING